MTNIVSITSQGQISIPAKIRRELGLNKTRKVVVSVQKGKVIVEPISDLLVLGGSLKTARRPSPQKIRQAFEDYLAQQTSND